MVRIKNLSVPQAGPELVGHPRLQRMQSKKIRERKVNTKLKKWVLVGYGIALLCASANHASAFYNASTGRWLNRDPIGDRPKQNRSKRWLREQSNLYHFTFNDPVNRRDILGLAVNDVDVVTFPVSKLNCPSTCGPDYTASVNAEIGRLRGYLAGLPTFPLHEEIMDADAQGGIATYNLSQFYLWFARLALSMKYDKQAKDAVTGVPLTGCPTAKCLGTITLCGKCVLSDVAGNIMFGFAAAGAGIGDSTRNFGANLAESFDFDAQADFPMFGDPDRDEFPLGKDLFNSGSSDICTVLNKLPNHGKRTDCAPCSKTSSFKPAAFPAYPRYQ